MSSKREVPDITEVSQALVNGVKLTLEPQTSLANDSTASTSACSQGGSSEVDGAPIKHTQSIEQVIQCHKNTPAENKELGRTIPSKLADEISSTGNNEEKPEVDTRTGSCAPYCVQRCAGHNDIKNSVISVPSGSNSAHNKYMKARNNEPNEEVKCVPTGSTPALNPEDPVVLQAYSLANFIIDQITKDEPGKPKGKIEETLLRNVNHLMTKHSITFRAMMKRLDVNKDTGYITFVSVANELFENEKKVITWSRIIALYAFGAQLALHCKEKGFVDYASNIRSFMGKYVADTAGHFVKQQGGWEKLVEEFPSEDQLGDTMWTLFAWSAMGLGLATATLFFASNR
ncbi:Blc2 family [Trinorchestia longiramus]|nr:Blc2 family [Trinorchestia longiramus]